MTLLEQPPSRSDAVTVRTGARLAVGDLIEVKNHFDGSWSAGFEVAEVLSGAGRVRYRIRRLSDGAVLPRLFVSVRGSAPLDGEPRWPASTSTG